jgi:DNA-binding PadR family transcriptional regulator
MVQATNRNVQATSTNRWMRGPSTPLRGALLGLLLERPGHGGELVSRLKGRLGETWRINYDDVYRLLKRLEEEGLASSRDEPKHDNRRGTHVVYHPTDRTRAAVETWMETLLPREPVRLGLQAKLAVADARDVPRLRLALREYERECLVLAQLVFPTNGEPRSWRALFSECTRDAVHGMLRVEIEWAARTRRRIDEYAARNP